MLLWNRPSYTLLEDMKNGTNMIKEIVTIQKKITHVLILLIRNSASRNISLRYTSMCMKWPPHKFIFYPVFKLAFWFCCTTGYRETLKHNEDSLCVDLESSSAHLIKGTNQTWRRIHTMLSFIKATDSQLRAIFAL